MAIDFEKLAKESVPVTLPELNFGYHMATIADAKIVKPVNDKKGYLQISWHIPVGKFTLIRNQRIYNFDQTLTTKSGETFQPIDTFVLPIRAHAQIAEDKSFSWIDAIKYASEHPVNTVYEQVEGSIFGNFSAAYPAPAPAPTVDNTAVTSAALASIDTAEV